MKITDEDLKIITALRRSRDMDAARLGAARHSYLELEETYRLSISRASELEESTGLKVLHGLGLDPVKDTYRITDDGAVQKLIMGSFVDLKDPGSG